MRTFRAATLNIWSRFGPWDERLVAIRHGIQKLQPDVLGMQEVLRNPAMDQAALVSDGLGYEIAWGISSENHGFPTGNAILSRWPIARSEVIPLPDGGSDEQRSVVRRTRLRASLTGKDYVLGGDEVDERRTRGRGSRVDPSTHESCGQETTGKGQVKGKANLWPRDRVDPAGGSRRHPHA